MWAMAPVLHQVHSKHIQLTRCKATSAEWRVPNSYPKALRGTASPRGNAELDMVGL